MRSLWQQRRRYLDETVRIFLAQVKEVIQVDILPVPPAPVMKATPGNLNMSDVSLGIFIESD